MFHLTENSNLINKTHALAKTDAVRGLSIEKLFHELCLETLEKQDGTGNYAL